MIGHDVIVGSIIGCLKVLGRYRQSDSIRDTLTQRTSCDFNSFVFYLWMAGTPRINAVRVVRLELVEGHCLVAGEVEKGVLEKASMSCRKSVTIQRPELLLWQTDRSTERIDHG